MKASKMDRGWRDRGESERERGRERTMTLPFHKAHFKHQVRDFPFLFTVIKHFGIISL